MTNSIKVTPDVLEAIARSIDSRSRNIETAIGSVNRIIGQINTSRFQGVRADFFRTNYKSQYARISNFARVLQAFSGELNVISAMFRNEDSRLAVGNAVFQRAGQQKKFKLSLREKAEIAVSLYKATHLKTSALRPNSMILTGPNWTRRLLGIKAGTRVIKPITFVKQNAVMAYIANIVEGQIAAIQSFTDPRYFGTSQALPAAVLDGAVKTAIGAAGTTLLLGATALIAKVTAPVWLVGGVIIGTWVVGGIALDKLAQTPVWEKWQGSSTREDGIRKGAEKIDQVKDFVDKKTQQGVETVRKAFSNFTQALLPV